METVAVTIIGVSPLLMNKYTIKEQNGTGKKWLEDEYSPVTDAEKALYKDDAGCYAPSTWLEATIREAAKTFKAGKGKGSMKGTVLSSVFVEPERIPLNKQTYDDIYCTPAVIKGNRIARSRPRFNAWSLEFMLTFDETRISKALLKEILEEAGITKGIGDYRPKFGRFKVAKFE
jgi:hypothetical protein